MKIVEKWTEIAKMKINKKKSGIIFLRHNKRSAANIEKFKEKNEKIRDYPINLEYKYLGVVFDEALKFDKHLDRIQA